MSSQSTIRPLDQVLQGIGLEIAAARDLAVRVEQVIEILGRHATGAEVMECQAADLLTQSLDGLAAYVDQLARSPGDGRLDIGPAAAAIRLSDQQHRLLGETADPATAQDLLLFGE